MRRVGLIGRARDRERIGALGALAPSVSAGPPTDPSLDCLLIVHAPPAFDAFEHLRASRGVGRPPAVVLVERGAAELRRALLRAGATEVVGLDVLDAEALAFAIEEAIVRSAAVREAEAEIVQSEEEARRSEQFAMRVIENLFAFVAVLDASGTLLAANEAPLAAAGIRIEDVRGKKFWDCYWWTYDEGIRAQLRAACARAAEGELVRYDVRARVAGDGLMLVDFQLAPLRDDRGRITHLIPSGVDITARVESEARVRASEERFRALADNIPQLAWMADATGYIGWYNRRWYEFTGTTLEEMQGWGWQKVHDPAHLEETRAKFVRHLASGEPWEDTFPIRGRDGRYRWFLSRAFPLRDPTGRIVNWFGTNTDVTAQREAELALREADRRKNEFIAMLAHELRNPLAPVRNAAEILRRLAPSDPRITRARDVIERQVMHMARLIDDLLDVSRISRGKLAVNKERCDLAAIAVQTAEDYRPSFEATGVQLSVAAPSAPAWVDGDPVRLAQMIGNLLHNACRFTDGGGHVDVRVDADGADARVTITDSGVGIDAQLLARLFDPFSQAEQDIARTKGGLGLGLALTKGLAELHGGRVEAHSDGLGLGARFTLHVPLRA